MFHSSSLIREYLFSYFAICEIIIKLDTFDNFYNGMENFPTFHDSLQMYQIKIVRISL
jgi:hypothetical protein